MKTININSTPKSNIANTRISMATGPEPEDRQPCWYANLDEASDRPKATWTVGIKEEGEDKREYSFRPSKAGDVTDDEFWQRITSPDFAVELIDTFRGGGEKAVKDWIKNGCL